MSKLTHRVCGLDVWIIDHGTNYQLSYHDAGYIRHVAIVAETENHALELFSAKITGERKCLN